MQFPHAAQKLLRWRLENPKTFLAAQPNQFGCDAIVIEENKMKTINQLYEESRQNRNISHDLRASQEAAIRLPSADPLLP